MITIFKEPGDADKLDIDNVHPDVLMKTILRSCLKIRLMIWIENDFLLVKDSFSLLTFSSSYHILISYSVYATFKQYFNLTLKCIVFFFLFLNSCIKKWQSKQK